MNDGVDLPSVPADLLLGTGPLSSPGGPVRLCLADRPEPERATILRECFSRIGYRYEMTPLSDVPFVADLALNALPDLLIMEGRLHGSRNRRTPALIDDSTDEAVLMINLEGPHLIEQFGKELVLGDGEAVLLSGTDPSCFTHKPPGNVLGLRFPKSRLAPLIGRTDACCMRRIPRGTAALSLLTGYLDLTWEKRVTASAELQQMMSAHIFDLTAAAIGATRGADAEMLGGGVNAARLHAIKQDIAKRLGQSNLSITELADRHRCTARFVQRLFEADGTTFTKYVLEQRLLRAYRLLSDMRQAGEKISSVAYDCGFGDVSYFNRAFRLRYGASPSDVRGQSRREKW